VTSNDGLHVVSGGSSPITLTGLTNGTPYTFTVTATNAMGTSTSSGTSGSVVPAGVPGVPTSISATGGNGDATITFIAPSNNGGAAIIRYTVTSNDGHTATGGSSPITLTGLTNGTTYTFTVTATNSYGTSTASAVSNSVTPATVPDAPTNVAATIGDSSAIVYWSAPAFNGGSTITYYTVTSNDGLHNARSGSSPVTITGLTNGNTYTFTVTATNAIGTSTPSGTSNSVSPSSVPSVPLNLTTTVQDSSIGLSWSPPTFSGGSAITDYLIEYQLTSGGTWSTFADIAASTPAITVTPLSNNSSYDFRVSAKNLTGWGPDSSVVSATPGPRAQVAIVDFSNLLAPTIVTDVRITNDEDTAYEYHYTWCVTDSEANKCGGGDDLFDGTNFKLIQPHENFDTALNSTVSAAGNYWFHLKVQFGSDSSQSDQSFTVVSNTPVTPPVIPHTGGGGGGGGGGSSYSAPSNVNTAAVVNTAPIITPKKCLLTNRKLADLNCDGKINMIDFSIMLSFWGTKGPFNNPYVDIKKDGKISMTDFSIMMYEWDKK